MAPKRGVLHLLSKSGGSSFNWCRVMAWTSSKWGNCLLFSSIWHWWSRYITPQKLRILTKVFYTSGPNLVILAWTVDALLCRQACWRMDRWTYKETQAMRIPRGHGCRNWPWVKTQCFKTECIVSVKITMQAWLSISKRHASFNKACMYVVLEG